MWKTEYAGTHDSIQVNGYSISEKDCLGYFATQVASKIAEADGAENLRTHLAELETTGFDTSILHMQATESSMQLKDWEVGEAFAEKVLEDEHEAMFPWETVWDKRTPRASLPGADIVGFQSKTAPRFIFGQVKSSSEKRVPPQNVNSGYDCLRQQMYSLSHLQPEQMQLIQWLLPRVRETNWENIFNDALKKYAEKDFVLVGVMVSGGRDIDHKDLTDICEGIQHTSSNGEMSLFGYYLPYDKKEWGNMVRGQGVQK